MRIWPYLDSKKDNLMEIGDFMLEMSEENCR